MQRKRVRRGDDASGGKRPWTTREIALAGLFAALTAVSAQLTIPLPLVPLTLQTLAALLAGAVLGARAGALSQVVYLLMGSVGLPVFAGRAAGIQVFAGPSGGYLIGFALCAWVVGRILEGAPRVTVVRGMTAMLAGIVAIYVPGVFVLSFHLDSWSKALLYGVVEFLPADLVKAVIAFFITRGLEARGISRPTRVAANS